MPLPRGCTHFHSHQHVGLPRAHISGFHILKVLSILLPPSASPQPCRYSSRLKGEHPLLQLSSPSPNPSTTTPHSPPLTPANSTPLLPPTNHPTLQTPFSPHLTVSPSGPSMAKKRLVSICHLALSPDPPRPRPQFPHLPLRSLPHHTLGHRSGQEPRFPSTSLSPCPSPY